MEKMEELVLMEAFAEVTGAMQEGVLFPSLEQGSKEAHVPFSELSRREKVGLLNMAVDWLLYSDFGLRPEQAWRIVENASDGRPQDQWLEPVRARHEQPAQPCSQRTYETVCNDGAQHPKGDELSARAIMLLTTDSLCRRWKRLIALARSRTRNRRCRQKMIAGVVKCPLTPNNGRGGKKHGFNFQA